MLSALLVARRRRSKSISRLRFVTTTLRTSYHKFLFRPRRSIQSETERKYLKRKVSYPGYVLIEAALVGQIPIIIRNIPNVLGFLGDTKEDSRKMNPTPLRPHEVSRILGLVDELSQKEEENETPFFVGETVKVTDGPFSSFQGTIESVDNEHRKLTVSVKIFGRKTPMELSFTQVEKE